MTSPSSIFNFLKVNLFGDPIIFSIEVSAVSILLNL